VTGVASGIGKAPAANSSAQGMNVVLADVEEDAPAKACEELGRGARNVIRVTADVSRPQAVDELARLICSYRADSFDISLTGEN
jgi:NAD(P)-dependent dehydrogenase (short-subunit alcohol dehydrogenase family)